MPGAEDSGVTDQCLLIFRHNRAQLRPKTFFYETNSILSRQLAAEGRARETDNH